MAYTINGQSQDLPAAVQDGGNTYVPISVVETLGGYVTWDNQNKTASIELGEKKLSVTAESNEVESDGQTYMLNAPAYIGSSHLYVPIDLFQTVLGYTVNVSGDDISISE